MAHSYIKASDLPQVIPVFPLAGAIVLPRGQLPLNIFEPRYLNPRGLDIDWDAAREAPPEALVNSLSMALPFEPAEKQALIEAMTLSDRLACLTALLRIDAAEPGDDEPTTMQ